jgi:hypothetical protein
MIAQSIAFENRTEPTSPAARADRFDGMILPMKPDSAKGPMPALAALATITPSVFAHHRGARRIGHAR